MDPASSGPYVMQMDTASAGTLPPGLTEVEAVELQLELSKVEDEIQTLKQVLSAKERHAAELRRRLGINPLAELKNNISRGWQEVQSSNAYVTASATLDDISRSETYKKTQETFSQAGQKTTSALSTVGSVLRNKLEGLRNSSTFKNLEDKMSRVVGNKTDADVVQPVPSSTPSI